MSKPIAPNLSPQEFKKVSEQAFEVGFKVFVNRIQNSQFKTGFPKNEVVADFFVNIKPDVLESIKKEAFGWLEACSVTNKDVADLAESTVRHMTTLITSELNYHFMTDRTNKMMEVYFQAVRDCAIDVATAKKPFESENATKELSIGIGYLINTREDNRNANIPNPSSFINLITNILLNNFEIANQPGVTKEKVIELTFSGSLIREQFLEDFLIGAIAEILKQKEYQV